MTAEPMPSPAPTIGVVLVDDHAIVRQGLRSLLDREPDLAVVGEADSAAAAIEVVERVQPQVVVLDLKLSPTGDSDGLEVCSELAARWPAVAVLVFTTWLEDRLVVEAIRRGARGYVVKDVDTSGLMSAIRDLARGESAFDGRSASAVVRGLHAKGTEERTGLTAREHEVLELLATGASNREIAGHLFIGETTAKFHVGNVLRKLGVSRRSEAVYRASQEGLI